MVQGFLTPSKVMQAFGLLWLMARASQYLIRASLGESWEKSTKLLMEVMGSNLSVSHFTWRFVFFVSFVPFWAFYFWCQCLQFIFGHFWSKHRETVETERVGTLKMYPIWCLHTQILTFLPPTIHLLYGTHRFCTPTWQMDAVTSTVYINSTKNISPNETKCYCNLGPATLNTLSTYDFLGPLEAIICVLRPRFVISYSSLASQGKDDIVNTIIYSLDAHKKIKQVKSWSSHELPKRRKGDASSSQDQTKITIKLKKKTYTS